MKVVLAFCSLLLAATAMANCRVYIPEKEFNYYGYVINFDFTKMLHDKNYLEVYSAEEADHVLKIEGIEQEGPRFHRAVAVIEMGETKVQESVLCFTQFCSVGDYGKAFSKSYKKMSSAIPGCR